MKRIEYNELTDNIFETIGKEWMLVSAGTPQHFNMMTASWGGLGWLWNKPVAFIFIRPERHTYKFVEEGDNITLSFLGNSKEARNIYQLCGTKSGRDINKAEVAGLKVIEMENGGVGYEQNRMTLTCRKLFIADMTEESFVDKSLLELWYNEKKGNLHRVYVVEITGIWINE
ncbi:MAG: flavin reductase [Paraprevotella sp.]|nr:flavin reductase [Paraprevotella sp.]